MLTALKRLVPNPIKNTYHFLQALFGALIFFFPSNRIKVIGITGTDGKTTTVNLVHHIFSECGKNSSMISTIGAKIGDKTIDTGLHVTTPDPFIVQKLLRRVADAGSEFAVLEVTSHGLAQERVAFVRFFAGVITNITHEHLDYHKSYKNYFLSKAKILNNVKYRVLNADEPSFKQLKDLGGGQLVSFGVDKEADFKADKLRLRKTGVEFDIRCQDKKKKVKLTIKSSLPGKFNVYNILAAFAITKNLGIDEKDITDAISGFQGVTGRMQYIDEGQSFDVIVDFAHTPQALEEALKSLEPLKKGKIIAVFGSAGERDVGKREMMGKVASEHADINIFTAEDPRGEDVNQIIDQIAAGAVSVGGIPNRTFWKVIDRAEAINTAIQTLASSGDTVILFGKGHEKSMNIAGKEYPWSDEVVARNALKARSKKP